MNATTHAEHEAALAQMDDELQRLSTERDNLNRRIMALQIEQQKLRRQCLIMRQERDQQITEARKKRKERSK